MLSQGVQDFVKHKVDENSAIIFCTDGIDRQIVLQLIIHRHFLLTATNIAFTPSKIKPYSATFV